MGKHHYGILSDTHGQLHDYIPEYFRGCQAILHAGDIGERRILSELEEIAPLYAVAGNCDVPTSKLPKLQVADLAFGFAGLTHGHLFPFDRYKRNDELLQAFAESDCRLIITGHTHHPYYDVHNGVILINPGACCPPRTGHIASIALLEWDDETDLFDIRFKSLDWTD
ncbi:YfcE family phosphodiesterase [Candidatus Sumerlaeota bacterium]|nr:YfcE family phosphodiesterase [Candidatus Sumerlaeota bacterium]